MAWKESIINAGPDIPPIRDTLCTCPRITVSLRQSPTSAAPPQAASPPAILASGSPVIAPPGDDHLTGPVLDALHRDVLRRVARPDQQQSLPRELVFVSEVVSVQDPAGEPLDTREL